MHSEYDGASLCSFTCYYTDNSFKSRWNILWSFLLLKTRYIHANKYIKMYAYSLWPLSIPKKGLK